MGRTIQILLGFTAIISTLILTFIFYNFFYSSVLYVVDTFQGGENLFDLILKIFFFPLYNSQTPDAWLATFIWLSILLLVIYFMYRFLRIVLAIIFSRKSILIDIPADQLLKAEDFRERTTLVIPAYNEAGTIEKVIRDHKKLVKQIIVVDDGSRDDTAAIAEQEGAHVVSHYRNMGLAKTMHTGLEEASKQGTDIIITTDADDQYSPEDVPKLVSALILRNADMVLGSRLKGKIESMPLMKKIGNIAFTRMLREMTGIPISDGQTGFRAFKKGAVKEIIPLMFPEFTYTQQQILIASHLRLNVKEVPIEFRIREDGSSRLMSGPLYYAYKAWGTLIVSYSFINPRKFLIRVGLVILALGIVSFSLTAPLSYLRRPPDLDMFVLSGILGIYFGLQTIAIAFLSQKH